VAAPREAETLLGVDTTSHKRLARPPPRPAATTECRCFQHAAASDLGALGLAMGGAGMARRLSGTNPDLRRPRH
jgi:hypothetical protein